MILVKSKIVFFLILLGIMLSFCESGFAQDDFSLIESKHFDIFYVPGVNIEEVNEKIKITFYDELLSSRIEAKGPKQQLANKLDLILEKVERILDMYPKRMNLKVKIYENQKELDRAYYQIFNQPNDSKRTSFYIHKYETIYTNQEAIRLGVIAHEMTHAVADHYFLILPSETVNEVLAQYVEMQLQD